MKKILLISLIMQYSCVHNTRQISYRDPKGFQVSRPEEKIIVTQVQPKTQTKIVKIVSKDDRSSSGSLMNLDDDRNLLFMEDHPLKVGDTIMISIVSPTKKETIPPQPSNQKSISAAPAPVPAAVQANQKSADQASPESKKNEEKADLTDLVKEFPSLEPPENQGNRVVRAFKMKVISELQNGDFRLLYARNSYNEESKRTISLEATLSKSKSILKTDINTDDLFDVSLTDTSSNDFVQRASSSWEDEYTLRVSGFTEEKSKFAKGLLDKQKQLENIKDKITKDIQDLSREKQLLAKERDDMIKERENTKNQLSSLSDKLKDSVDTIQKQKETIKNQESEMDSLKNLSSSVSNSAPKSSPTSAPKASLQGPKPPASSASANPSPTPAASNSNSSAEDGVTKPKGSPS